MKTKVLVTGGSGAVGTPLLQLLSLQDKYDVTVFDLANRKTRKAYLPYRDKIKVEYGDLTNVHQVESVCKNVDVVIHLGAIIPPMADENPDLAYRVNVEGTENLILSLERYSANAFFIYASSVSVYGDRLNNPQITTNDPLIPSYGDEYAKTKIEAEKLLMASSLNWSIFRLSAIFGINNLRVTGLMFHMPLGTPIEFTTPEDTARAFYHALEKQEVLNRKVFNLGGGETCRISYQQFLSRSFAISGLGQLNFPEKAFADKNFHCGYYADGDELEELLSFRRDSVSSYFSKLEQSMCQYILPFPPKITPTFLTMRR